MSNVPADLRAEVNRRLRLGYYSQEDVRGWLALEGYEIGKSSFNRYAVALRENDGNEGVSPIRLAAKNTDPDGLSSEQQILLELGRLKVREAELLEQLRNIVGS
ncbi:MAG: phage protein Gp27 family protein [Marinobacterium sp.]